MSLAPDLAALARIQQFYEGAAMRMMDTPMYNDALQVAVLGWQRLGEQSLGTQDAVSADDHLGVLITPWGMSLFWQPAQAPQHLLTGDTLKLALHSGEYELTLAPQEHLGWYGTASLFSMMSEFATQAQALETAQEVIAVILPEPETAEPDAAEVEANKSEATAESAANATSAVNSDAPAVPSRRQFFRRLGGLGR